MKRRGLQWTGPISRLLHSRPAARQKVNESWNWRFAEGLRNHWAHGSCSQRQWVRYHDQSYRNGFLRHKSQQNTLPPLYPFAARPCAEEIQKKRYRATIRKIRSEGAEAASSVFFTRIVRRLMKFVGGVVAIMGAGIAGAPYFVSWPSGLQTVLFLINSSIPGTLSVESISLGWNEPIHIEGVILRGPDSNVVLSIPEYKTNAHLWPLVVGRAGLGDTVVIQPTVDMRNDPESGHPYYDLALTSVDKLNVSNPYVKKNFKVLPSEVVPWTAKMLAPEGGLEVLNGKVILPGDLAAVLGAHLYFDIAFGRYATETNPPLWKAKGDISWRTPVRCSLWSNCAHLEAQAYLNLRRKRMELVQPLRAEMDLSPALAKFYLAQINPILGQIVGPSVGREDLPDVSMSLKPTDMMWPTTEYLIRIEPMKVVLVNGPLLHDLFALLTRGDIEKGNRKVVMQTSVIEANVHVGGNLTCSRVDLLIADKIHVATWGQLDHVHEIMKMVLAIPGKSLIDLLGLTRITPDYYLQIPVHGTFDRPQVDWVSAARRITQLTMQEKLGGNLLSAFLNQFDDVETSVVPKPIGDLPWARG